MCWATGTDLKRRIIDHRMALGDGTAPLPQGAYGRLWGRSYKAVSAWENGHALPPPGAIEMAVTRNGWDDRMFRTGGPMPSTLPRSPGEPRTTNGPRLGRAEQVKRQIAIWAVEYERRGDVLAATVVGGWMQMLEDAIRSESAPPETPRPTVVPPSGSRPPR